MVIIVDSNVILDILTEDKQWYKWFSEQLMSLSEDNELLINQVTYSETYFNNLEIIAPFYPC